MSRSTVFDTGTLDLLRMWRVIPWSELKVYYERSHSVLCDEGVFVFDVCPLGVMCKLDSPWLNPFLFVFLSGWFVASREQPVLADLCRFCWEPGGTQLIVFFSQECASVVCRDFAPKVDPNLINRSSDCFELLCGIGGVDVSSLCVPPELFDRACHNRPCLIWGHWLSQVFTLMCLEQLCCWEVIQYGPVRA